jgi:SagB-type dehydrogenase family enzyme
MTTPDTDIFAETRDAFARVGEIATELGLASGSPAGDVVALLTHAVDQPVTAFVAPPEYVRSDLDDRPAYQAPPARTEHAFFDVLRARGSRRDFGDAPLSVERLFGLLAWSVGQRGETIAYDYRGAPTRFVPSAGGLNTVDAYVVAGRVDGLAPGAYYYDYRRGLVPVSDAVAVPTLAASNPGQEWVQRAGALVVFVANMDRASRKYGVMAAKLAMFDVGVTAGHMELVAAALELRSCLLGGLPPSRLSEVLDLPCSSHLPMLTLAVGTRPGER